MEDYIAYVAKDQVSQRGTVDLCFCLRSQCCSLYLLFLLVYLQACHILECPQGRAAEVIHSISWAFESRFKQLLCHSPSLVSADPRSASWETLSFLVLTVAWFSWFSWFFNLSIYPGSIKKKTTTKTEIQCYLDKYSFQQNEMTNR